MKNFKFEILNEKRYLVFELESYHNFVDIPYSSLNLDIIPFELVKNSSSRKLLYRLSHRIPIKDFLTSGVLEEYILNSLLDLCNSIIDSDSKGLMYKNFYLDMDCIYFNVKSRRFELIYIPVENYHRAFDISKVFSDIIYETNFKSNEVSKILILLKFLKSSKLTDVLECKNFLINLIRGEANYESKIVPDDTSEITILDESLEETEILDTSKFILSSTSDSNIDLPLGSLILGRGADSDIKIDISKKVSRKHISLLVKLDSVQITDLESKNGTYVNNIKLESSEVISLTVGDHILIGDLEYTLEKIDDYR